MTHTLATTLGTTLYVQHWKREGCCILVMAVGAEVLVWTWRRLCLRLRSCTRPNMHKPVTRYSSTCAISVSDSSALLAKSACKFCANSGGGIVSSEYVSHHQNTTERLAHSCSLTMLGKKPSLFTCPELGQCFYQTIVDHHVDEAQ